MVTQDNTDGFHANEVAGKTFVLTGALPSLAREDAKEKIEAERKCQ